jgi:hypothetical protein
MTRVRTMTAGTKQRADICIVGWLVAAQFVDQVGKGIRGAPRDALVADSAPPEFRGTAFGIFNLAGG